MDQYRVRQSEHAGRLQAGAHHAVHYQDVGRETGRRAEHVVPRPRTEQRVCLAESASRRTGAWLVSAEEAPEPHDLDTSAAPSVPWASEGTRRVRR